MVDLDLGESRKSSIKLPKSLQLHCLVKINEHQVLLIGGLSKDGAEEKTYLFDMITLSW